MATALSLVQGKAYRLLSGLLALGLLVSSAFADTTKYVNTDCTFSGNGAADISGRAGGCAASGGAAGAWNSCTNAVAGAKTLTTSNLVTAGLGNLIIDARGVTADAQCTWDIIVTDATHLVRYQTSGANRPRLAPWIDPTKYRFSCNTNALGCLEDRLLYMEIDGIQADNTATGSGSYDAIAAQTAAELSLKITNTVTHCTANSGTCQGIYFFPGVANTRLTVFNNLSFGPATENFNFRAGGSTNSEIDLVYNNGAYGGARGYRFDFNGLLGSLTFKNNWAQSNATTGYFSSSTAPTLVTSNNVTADATSPDAGGRSKTITFVNTATNDFRLASTDTSAKAQGTNSVGGLFTTDLTGYTENTTWDVGPLRAVPATDTLLCSDDNDDGVIGVIKGVGKNDRDCDGELSVTAGGSDCDDTVSSIHKGSWTTSGCTGGQYRQCSSTGLGTYGACTAANIGERTNNYYISGTGSGSTCSYASPCAISAVSTGGAVTIVAPAAVYIVGSTDITATAGFVTAVAGSSAGTPNILSRDPLSTARLRIGGGNCATSCASVKINANNWLVRGLEVMDGDQTGSGGIRLEGNNNEATDNWVHDVVCDNNVNCSGIYGGDNNQTGLWVHNNIVSNVADGTRALASDDRQNVWDIGMFPGAGMLVERNFFGYDHLPNTPPYYVQGGGVRIKHGLTAAHVATPMELRKNSAWETEVASIQTSSAATWMHGNLIQSSAHGVAITGPNGGDGTYFQNIQNKNNTIKSYTHYQGGTDTNGAIQYMTNADPDGVAVGGVITSGNVIDDSLEPSYGGGNYTAMFSIVPYGTDAGYTAVITNATLVTTGNCYYNSAIAALTSGFNVFGDNSSTAFGSIVNYANWKLTPYFFDLTGANGNPTFDANMDTTANCPAGSGWAAEWPSPSAATSPTGLFTQLMYRYWREGQ